MRYHNDTIRRQNRLLDEASAICLLREGEYGFLAMQAEQGGGYGLPLHYVWNGKDSIYLHCAPEGRKLRCLDLCDRITFCIVGRTQLVPHQFSTEYESILLTGTARTILDTEEKMKALELIVDKYASRHKEKGMKYAASSVSGLTILRLDISEWSGKCRPASKPADNN
ncbi:MAG: pyridoxamine 5'-phosphate oxidase family protein [Bacteroides sp.]|nr:pyridoxamine 5'-phosphate oxidase family protein [Bacteroides sp.]